jgi:hypothetical protein
MHCTSVQAIVDGAEVGGVGVVLHILLIRCNRNHLSLADLKTLISISLKRHLHVHID